MATYSVINDNEVFLNTKKYKLLSPLRAQYIPRMPSKVNIGSDSYDREQFLSNWIIKDQRGGILIDEMDESVHADRSLWTDCITSHDGHMVLPRLATKIAVSSAVVTAPTITNADMELTTGWTNGSRSSAAPYQGTYHWASGATADTYQDLTPTFPGAAVTFTCYGRVDATGVDKLAKIGIDDGVTTTWSNENATATYALLTVAKTLSIVSTQLRLLLYYSGGASNAYYDLAAISVTTPSTLSGTIPRFGMANFNGGYYLSIGSSLIKLNSSRDGWAFVGQMPATITALIPGKNSRLYIYLGDSTNYHYMTTTEAIVPSNSANAYWGIQHADNLWKLNTSGTFSKSSDPDGATPTWSNEGDITDIASEIESLEIGRDTSGTKVIYCATNSVLKVYDETNTKWLNTEVRLPSHPIGGQGCSYWNSALYLSYGLGIRKYAVGNSQAIETEVGLNREGGLLAEYNGEIVAFSGDSTYHMLALVDSSIPTGDSQSGLYAWNDKAWECWWVAPDTVIEDCEDAWNELVDTDVTASLDTSDYQMGTGSAKFVVAALCAAGDIIATEAISSTDLSAHTTVKLNIKSTVALNASDLQLLLDDTASCATPLETLNIPAVTANTWTVVELTLANPSTDTAIISVGIKMAVDKGAFTLNVDHIFAPLYNKNMHSVIVSSAQSGYAAYWDCGGNVYYTDLARGLQNPKQLSGTQKYQTRGIYISPHFDAGTTAYKKLIKRLTTFASSITTTETITLKYRANYTYIDRDSGWTLLSTLDTTAEAGEVEQLFASGAGSALNSLQYRLDFLRGSTNTNTPDLNSMVTAYQLITTGTWIWIITVGIENLDDTARTMDANIASAIESSTLVPFIFRSDATNETHYVRAFLRDQQVQTGDNFKGRCTLELIEV